MKEKYYQVVVYQNGKRFCIDAADYIFDTDAQTVSLLSSKGQVMRKLDFKNGDADRIIIFDKAHPQEEAVQQILRGPVK